MRELVIKVRNEISEGILRIFSITLDFLLDFLKYFKILFLIIFFFDFKIGIIKI